MTAPAEEQRPEFMDLWDFGDPPGTEAKLRALLPAARETANVSYLAQLLTQIARTEGLQHKLPDAHQTLDEVERLIDEKDLPVARLRYLIERGRAFDSPAHPKDEKQTDQARPLFEEAFELGRARGLDRFALDASHMLGIIESPETALAWNLRSIELAQQTEDEKARGWLGALAALSGKRRGTTRPRACLRPSATRSWS